MSGLPDKWIETTLGEVCFKITDGSHHSPKAFKNGYPMLSVKDMNNFGFNLKNCKTISKDDYKKLEQQGCKPDYGDILIAKDGSVLKHIFMMKQELDVVLLSSIAILKPNKQLIESQYVVYFLLNPFIKRYILNHFLSGSGVPRIVLKDFKQIQFKIPPLLEQKSIANILSSFDEKIELLREQNETLETLAQTIFKEWFVNFNYPDATGEMVDSELGEIPKGWRVYDLNELVDTVNGYSYKGKELVESSDEALVTLKSFNRNGGFQTRGFKPFIGMPKQQQEVKVGDLVVAHTDLTQDAEVLGNPAFIFEDAGYSKMYITMDLVKVVSKNKNIDNVLVYYIMKDRRFKGHCIGYSNGTTVLHLSKKSIPEYKIAFPENLQLAKDFSNYANSLTNKISNNIYQIQTLTKTRDTLLPKLMSGQVRVN